jgi:hypothetical protein
LAGEGFDGSGRHYIQILSSLKQFPSLPALGDRITTTPEGGADGCYEQAAPDKWSGWESGMLTRARQPETSWFFLKAGDSRGAMMQ